MIRNKKTAAWFMIIVLAVSTLLSACGKTPVQNQEPVTGILEDESGAKLAADMESGKIPSQCRVMYDESGARPEIVVSDPETITDLYNRFSKMTVGPKSDISITDCYHYICFTLQDGTELSWSFEGTGLLCRGQENYEVSDEGGLWSKVRQMQDEWLEKANETEQQNDVIEQEGVTQTAAVYPAAIAANLSAQEFMESEAHWNWWDSYRDKTGISASYRENMNTYYQNIMEKILVADEENTVCSPLNTYVAFALLAEVSGGNTRQQILDMLGVSDIETLRTQVEALWDSNYVNTPVLQSLLANSLWLRESTEFKDETLNRLAQQYHASSFRGVTGSEEMNQALQAWTDKNTGGLLSEYTKGMKLDAATVMAIVSTIYYKAAWVDKFFPENTTQETFHGIKGDSTVDMMHRTDTMSVCRTDNFTAVEVSLSDSGSMYFYLPQEGVDVNALAKDPDLLKAAAFGGGENWSNPMVHLSVPKFNISAQTDLIDIIRELGVTDALDPSVSDFTPLTEDVDELYLSAANHAAMVEIDESGVTGAAYTELVMTEGVSLPSEEIDIVFDRPFMFVVTGADGSILFSGIVRNI